jgi:environmental stress-induced protein Ves
MQLTHLTLADYKRMPWKNGGGMTTEIMSEPCDGGYDWRISIAEVAQSGPFSDFSDYDRTIMLLDGAGFTLEFEQRPAQRISHSFEPFRFDGGLRTHCTLIGGPVRDFNLMARKGTEAVLEVLRLVPGAGPMRPAHTTLLHLFHGQISACGRDLNPGETLRIDGATAPLELALHRPSIAALIRIGGAA